MMEEIYFQQTMNLQDKLNILIYYYILNMLRNFNRIKIHSILLNLIDSIY